MFIRIFASVILMLPALAMADSAPATGVATISNSAALATNNTKKTWYDRAFEKELKAYAGIKDCISYTAKRFKLQRELLVAVLMQENGLAAPVRKNSNGTYDLGAFQINQVRLPELKRFDVTAKQLAKNACLNTFMAGYILWKEIQSADSFWQGVGNYHYGSWGENPQHHYRYIDSVYKNWQRLTRLD